MLPDLFVNAQLSPEQQQALGNLADEVAEARTHIKQLLSRIAELEEEAASEHAILTRPEFNREVARMLAFDERYGGMSSVLYFDFTGLSKLDPTLSAEAARVISDLFVRQMRRSDIVGRLGNDEFGVLLIHCNNDNAWRKGRAIAAMLVNALDTVGGTKPELTVSFGAYTFRDEEDVALGLKEAAQVVTRVEKK